MASPDDGAYSADLHGAHLGELLALEGHDGAAGTGPDATAGSARATACFTDSGTGVTVAEERMDDDAESSVAASAEFAESAPSGCAPMVNARKEQTAIAMPAVPPTTAERWPAKVWGEGKR